MYLFLVFVDVFKDKGVFVLNYYIILFKNDNLDELNVLLVKKIGE